MSIPPTSKAEIVVALQNFVDSMSHLGVWTEYQEHLVTTAADLLEKADSPAAPEDWRALAFRHLQAIAEYDTEPAGEPILSIAEGHEL
jgi:hypothetical protein